jgi:cytochrome c oxidase subunit II
MKIGKSLMILVSITVLALIVNACSTPQNTPVPTPIMTPTATPITTPTNSPEGSLGGIPTETPASNPSSSPTATPADPPGSTQFKTIKITAYQYGFTIDGPEIHKGDRVKIIATSSDVTHGLAIPDFNVNLQPLNPGSEMTTEFVADKAGSFVIFCNVPCGPGHRSMRATLTVLD